MDLRETNVLLICIFFPGGEAEGGGSGVTTPTPRTPAQRKKKPKRRSTGVVNIDFDVSCYQGQYFVKNILKKLAISIANN